MAGNRPGETADGGPGQPAAQAGLATPATPLTSATSAKQAALEIYQASLDAADPAAAVARTLVRQGSKLSIGARSYDLASLGGVRLLALGKAAAAMARGAQSALGDSLLGGVVVTLRGSIVGKDNRLIGPELPVPFIESSHPVPDQSSVAGARALLAQAQAASASGQLALILISGGGSALAELPAPPLTLDELRATTELLLRSGADIREMNVVRKHLSAFKGGQLALAAAPAPVVTLLLSDVVGSSIDAIASGPSVPDPSTWAHAAAILRDRDLLSKVPAAVRARIEQGTAGEIADTPKADHPALRGQVVILGDAALSAQAAQKAAARLGYEAQVVTAALEGDAEAFARSLPEVIRNLRERGHPARPLCLIYAGETTVVVRGKGRGGRNQQLALAFAAAIDGEPGVTLAALATDGIDGPTDAAGAIVDGGSAAQMRAAGVDVDRSLQENNAGPALDAVGALVQRGPSGTNVNDLILLLIE